MGVSRLPDGIVREATAPQQLVVVWAGAQDVGALLDATSEAGFLAMRLAPQDTEEFLSVSGFPSMLLIDSDLLDEQVVATIHRVRADVSGLRVAVLAGADAGARGLRHALSAGVSEVIDPGSPESIAAFLSTTASITPGERVLAVGAHPDDVEIGCGATLLRHRDQGHWLSVLTLSRGAVGGPREDRRREAIGASIAMSAELLMGDLTDTRMGEDPSMITLIEDVIAAVRPTTVYVHSVADNHQDHRAVHDATLVAARRVPQLFCYQSPSSRNGFSPTKFVPVDDTILQKVEVLAHYRSQATRHYLDPELVVATGRYWARQLPHARYAEPFEVVRASEPQRS